MDIAIVIPCYKRTLALKELCQGLLKAQYDEKVTLIFSIDFSGNDDVLIFAKDFYWPFGPKRIIEHKTNIGLRNNILYCGDLTLEYDAVIVIEDDLEVSPSFYRFAKKAAEFYKNDDRIGGISIYQYFIEEISQTQFFPIYEGYDAYFVQWASSWGQLWTRKQWTSFKEWYNLHTDISEIPIPRRLQKWNESWKKYYIAYLVDTNRFFVFPFLSRSYNGNKEGGVHTSKQLVISASSPFDFIGINCFNFPHFDDCNYKYDVYFQLTPRYITVNGKEIKVEFDLFGHKDFVQENYIITSKECNANKIIYSFDSGMLPLECNILLGKKGKTFHLISKTDFNANNGVPLISSLKIRQSPTWKKYFKLFFYGLYDAMIKHLVK